MPVAPRDELSDVSPLEAEAVAVVAFEGVSVWRSDGSARTTVLDDIDWLVRPGEHWGIIGANGAGKTTLLRMQRPRSGRAPGRQPSLEADSDACRCLPCDAGSASSSRRSRGVFTRTAGAGRGSLRLLRDDLAHRRARSGHRGAGTRASSQRGHARVQRTHLRELFGRRAGPHSAREGARRGCVVSCSRRAGGGSGPSWARAPARGARERDSRAPWADDAHGHPPHRRAACDHLTRVAPTGRRGGRRRPGSSRPHRYDPERMLRAGAPGRPSRRPFLVRVG